jgi:hypothetical protein
LTLAMRPIGAFIFGRAADRWGRRPTLMINILLYSILEFASGFGREQVYHFSSPLDRLLASRARQMSSGDDMTGKHPNAGQRALNTRAGRLWPFLASLHRRRQAPCLLIAIIGSLGPA